MRTIESLSNGIQCDIGPLRAFLASDTTVFTLNMDLNKIKFNSVYIIFVKFQHVFPIVKIKLEKVYPSSKTYTIFEGSKNIYNKIQRAPLFSYLAYHLRKSLF